VSLGAAYPWYLTVLIPPPIILSAALVGRAFSLPGAAGKGLGVGVALCLAVAAEGPVRATFAELAAENPIEPWEAFVLDRRMAGIFLAEYAGPEELVASAYGWVAFEARRPVNDTSGINSQVMRAPVMYQVEHGYPAETGSSPPAVVSGMIPLATFNRASERFPGYSWFTVMGRPESAIARSGRRLLEYRLFELPPPVTPFPELKLKLPRIEGMDLVAHPPSGATFTFPTAAEPIHLLFTPGFAQAVPLEQTDGVTFQVWSNGERLYDQHLLPGIATAPVSLVLPSRDQKELRVSLVTLPGPRDNPDYDWAVWRSVKLVIGKVPHPPGF
jgi:hypothetical protein